jgi:hypothetical protein
MAQSNEDKPTIEVLLERIARELKTIREQTTKALFALSDAETEIPEKLRRFMSYTHDTHAMKFMYEEVGHSAPAYLMRELERVDDRYRQIMKEMKTEGGPINKVLREMAADPNNRWDHTKLLPKQTTESNDEARPSPNVEDGIDKDGAELPSG